MQRLEVSGAVRHTHISLGGKGLTNQLISKLFNHKPITVPVCMSQMLDVMFRTFYFTRNIITLENKIYW
jgi:hypothetical protein